MLRAHFGNPMLVATKLELTQIEAGFYQIHAEPNGIVLGEMEVLQKYDPSM